MVTCKGIRRRKKGVEGEVRREGEVREEAGEEKRCGDWGKKWIVSAGRRW
ncbi:MAG: hypothetical protein IJU80_00965 [Lachnospiraceae bacterium]|nr:hypothetical protein [Lachnospiraceae bacterium]